MNYLRSKKAPTLIFLLLLALATSGCGQLSGASNFTLAGGETVSGPLLLFSNNAILEKDSQVEGPVFMLCCNLIVDGKVNGDVYLLTGNLKIDVHADVDGDVGILSGNLSQ